MTGWREAAKKLDVELAMLIDERGEVMSPGRLSSASNFRKKAC